MSSAPRYLFGTGAGIAFFMLMAQRTGRADIVAHVAGTVVIADTIFTATAVIVQPITGVLLAQAIGWPLSEGWIVLSLLLYVVTALFWLPVSGSIDPNWRAGHRPAAATPVALVWPSVRACSR